MSCIKMFFFLVGRTLLHLELMFLYFCSKILYLTIIRTICFPISISDSINIIRTMSSTSGIVESTIRNKLQSSLEAKHLDIINESYMHNVPKGAETHFKVVVVSDKFDGLPLIKVIRNMVLYHEYKLLHFIYFLPT